MSRNDRAVLAQDGHLLAVGVGVVLAAVRGLGERRAVQRAVAAGQDPAVGVVAEVAQLRDRRVAQRRGLGQRDAPARRVVGAGRGRRLVAGVVAGAADRLLQVGVAGLVGGGVGVGVGAGVRDERAGQALVAVSRQYI